MAKTSIGTCLACKKIFHNPYKNSLCPSCMKLMEDRFQEVRHYIKDNENVSVDEVSKVCRVPKGQILKWIREERLYFSKGSDIGVPCLKCGVTIQTGKFCVKCRKLVKNELKSVYIGRDDFSATFRHSGKNQMHYLNKDKK